MTRKRGEKRIPHEFEHRRFKIVPRERKKKREKKESKSDKIICNHAASGLDKIRCRWEEVGLS